jgi:hypothetical protein
MRRLFVMVAVVIGVLAPAAAASAQSYPPAAQAEVRDFGAQRAGDTFNKVDCGFMAGTTATIRLNSTDAGTRTVGSDGCVRLAVTIDNESQVSIDGRAFPANRCARNSIFVSAPIASGAATNRVVDNRFTISCPGTAAAGVARTGQNIARWSITGVALTALGTVLVVFMRRRRDAAELPVT